MDMCVLYSQLPNIGYEQFVEMSWLPTPGSDTMLNTCRWVIKGQDGGWLHITGPITNCNVSIQGALCTSSVPSSPYSELCGVCTFLSTLASD
ncbi:hypothetical protein KIN20_021817 [Parelaphostrongylus tenuis]|uniref:Uncharacterized protein n=1 Tax=Parelaphostrongylus tenuis TaxID=148309 RepID=A0AAD5N8A9_PARTN|nr:hypothetical protein KIN20_021817 [Parelaphostrongylus tenuis]